VTSFADLVVLGVIPTNEQQKPLARVARVLPAGLGQTLDSRIFYDDVDAVGQAMTVANALSKVARNEPVLGITEVLRCMDCFYALAPPSVGPSLAAWLDVRSNQRRPLNDHEQAIWLRGVLHVATVCRRANVDLVPDALLMDDAGVVWLRGLSTAPTHLNDAAQVARLWQFLGGPRPSHRQAYALLLQGRPLHDVAAALPHTTPEDARQHRRSIGGDVDAFAALAAAEAHPPECDRVRASLSQVYDSTDVLYPVGVAEDVFAMPPSTGSHPSNKVLARTQLIELPQQKQLASQKSLARTLPTLLVSDVTRAASRPSIMVGSDLADDDVFGGVAQRTAMQPRPFLPSLFGDAPDVAVDDAAFQPLVTAHLDAPLITTSNVSALDDSSGVFAREGLRSEVADPLSTDAPPNDPDLDAATMFDAQPTPALLAAIAAAKKLAAAAAAPVSGTVDIDVPADATVVLDGLLLGRGPQRMDNVSVSKRMVLRVDAPGCLPSYQVIMFPPGSTMLRVQVALARKQ
jgi:hypothetical protein